MGRSSGEVLRLIAPRAVEIMGGTPALANHLRISQRKLQHWLDRSEPVPWEISLLVVEIVVPVLLTELFARHKA